MTKRFDKAAAREMVSEPYLLPVNQSADVARDERFKRALAGALDEIERLEAANGVRREPLADGREHLTVSGTFQSDKYPWCAAGFVPLKLGDPLAQDLLALYARRRAALDEAFARDLLVALESAGAKVDGLTVMGEALDQEVACELLARELGCPPSEAEMVDLLERLRRALAAALGEIERLKAAAGEPARYPAGDALVREGRADAVPLGDSGFELLSEERTFHGLPAVGGGVTPVKVEALQAVAEIMARAVSGKGLVELNGECADIYLARAAEFVAVFKACQRLGELREL